MVLPHHCQPGACQGVKCLSLNFWTVLSITLHFSHTSQREHTLGADALKIFSVRSESYASKRLCVPPFHAYIQTVSSSLCVSSDAIPFPSSHPLRWGEFLIRTFSTSRIHPFSFYSPPFFCSNPIPTIFPPERCHSATDHRRSEAVSEASDG